MNLDRLIKLPLAAKLALLLLSMGLVAAIAYQPLIEPRQERLVGLQGEKQGLEAQIAQQRRVAADLPRFRQECESLQQSLDQALTILPSEREIPSLLMGIGALAGGNNLDLLRLKPEAEAAKEFYSEVPMRLTLSGEYLSITRFFDDLGHWPRIVNASDLKVSNPRQDAGRTLITVDAGLTTFRFTDAAAPAPAAKPAK